MATDFLGDYMSERTSVRLTYSVEEAGRLLGISRNSAYNAATAGQIPTIRIGNRLLVPKAAIDRLLGNPSATA